MNAATRLPRVMLLVDADNVSADVIEQAIDAVMDAHGAIHVRRAYCTPESAVKNASLFKRLSLRPMVNLSTGKNATDIALAVDALDLAIAERPDVAVIVSSDSDFAPLVLRLREKGCRVEGIGQHGKTADASKGVYDGFVDLVHRKAGARAPAPRPGRASQPASLAPVRPSRPAAAALAAVDGPPPPAPPSSRPARKRRGSPAEPVDAPVATSVPTPDASPTSPPRPTRGRAARTASPPVAPEPASDGEATTRRAARPADAQAVPDEVAAILTAVPPLAGGQPVALGIAAERLRAAGLLARSAASTRLFRQFADHFRLAPARQPNTVQYVGAAKALAADAL